MRLGDDSTDIFDITGSNPSMSDPFSSDNLSMSDIPFSSSTPSLPSSGISSTDLSTINNLFNQAFAPVTTALAPSTPAISATANSLYNSMIPVGSSAVPPSYNPAPVSTPGAMSTIEAWLAKSSVIAGVANSWVLLGTGVLLIAMNSKKKQRRR